MKSKTKSSKTPIAMIGVTLPVDYPWKVLSSLVSNLGQFLDDDELWLLNYIIRNRDIDSYYALSEAWGLQCNTPEDTCVAKLRARYQLASVLKKFRFSSSKTERVDKALRIFREAESKCQDYNNFGYLSLKNETPQVFYGMRSFLRDLLGEEIPGSRAFVTSSRHGPGANLDTYKGQTSLYDKFGNWPYSCTIRAYRYARFIIETDQRWYGALQDDYRNRKNIPMHYPLDLKRFWADVIRIVDENRITFVPKDAQKERTIAIEPALNLFLQLGVDGFIRGRLKRYGIDLDDQTKNQELARIGSMCDDENSFCTIDIKAASDSISMKLCELVLPSDWYRFLCDLRSPFGTVNGERLEFNKLSSMGNGYTFALESALFAAVIVTAIRVDGCRVRQGDFAIFGDDLVVRKKHVATVTRILANCGFTINSEKTFLSGPIRESCGTDWFRGLPLRPVFLSETPSTTRELFTDLNRLNRILILRWGLEESSLSSLYLKWIPDKAKSLIGPFSDEDFDSYRHVAASPRRRVNDVYKYYRLIELPIPRKGQNFFFRKLMASLRGTSVIPIPKWESRKKVAGSKFAVTTRNRGTVRLTYSISDIWRSTYEEYYPPNSR